MASWRRQPGIRRIVKVRLTGIQLRFPDAPSDRDSRHSDMLLTRDKPQARFASNRHPAVNLPELLGIKSWRISLESELAAIGTDASPNLRAAEPTRGTERRPPRRGQGRRVFIENVGPLAHGKSWKFDTLHATHNTIMIIADLRTDYSLHGLTEDDAGQDPLPLFHTWLNQAIAANVLEPNAMTLATSTPDGRPSARVVLLKICDERGAFFSNYNSRKGAELAIIPSPHPSSFGMQSSGGFASKAGFELTSEAESNDCRHSPREQPPGGLGLEQSEVLSGRASWRLATKNTWPFLMAMSPPAATGAAIA